MVRTIFTLNSVRIKGLAGWYVVHTRNSLYLLFLCFFKGNLDSTIACPDIDAFVTSLLSYLAV